MDWQEIFLGKEEWPFFLEIIFRTVIMFLVVVVTLNFTGKRGVKQLSIFEMVMIITLGSAAGDPMFYKEVGILHAVMVFVIVLLCYRFIIWLITRFDKIEILFEGKPIYIIREGRFNKDVVGKMQLGSDELFAELRNKSIDHLGQIKTAILETNGSLSILYFSKDAVLPGLPIWPEPYSKKAKMISEEGLYACSKCGVTEVMAPARTQICIICKNDEWVETLDCPRTV